MINEDALWAIERRIDEVPFRGVPMGATLNDVLIGLAASGGNVHDAWREALTLACSTLPKWGRQCSAVPVRDTGRFAFTWVDDTPRLTDMVLPVIRALGDDACVVIGRQPSMRSPLPPTCGFYLEPMLGEASWMAGYPELSIVAPRWWNSLPAVLSPSVKTFLLRALVQNSRRMVRVVEGLRRLSPRVLVVEFDRGAFASCLVLAAKSLGIPTLTMVHGAVSTRGLTPLLADVALCWGEEQVEAFVGLGTDSDRLVVTGCQRASNSVADTATIRRRIGIADQRNVALLATTHAPSPASRLEFARMFCEAVQRREDVVGLVRVHPRERADDYSQLATEFGRIQFFDNSAMSTEEALALASIVVCGDTSFPLDAAIHGCPVVLLELPGASLRGSRLAMGGCGPVVGDVAKLTDVLDRYFDDEYFRAELRRLSKRHGARVCAATGDDAAYNVAREVRRRARPTGASW